MAPTPPVPSASSGGDRPQPGALLHGLSAVDLWASLEDPPADAGAGDAVLLRLPGLDLMEVIDRGGMGIVYRARDTDGGRTVAVKMLLTRHEADPEMVARIRQEATAVSSMDHPGILPVYRVGEHEGLPFFSMKLAAGGSLTGHLAGYAGEWRKTAQLMAGLADAIHHAHQCGVLHRDVKPGNVLFDAAGLAYVSDFGLVKLVDADSALTRSVNLMGTPHYMAPEVAARNVRSATTASDVWSLGAVLYELLAQHRPFDAPGIPALLRCIVEEPPAPILATKRPPRDLLTIALKCLEKEPARRYASAAALRDDLHAWLEGRPIAASPPSRMEATRLWMRRNKALTIVSALALAMLAAGAVALAAKNRDLKSSLAQEQYARATAIRRSGDIRGRHEALTLLSNAAPNGTNAAAARDEAITLLATPGWSELRRIPLPPVTVPVLPDFSRLIQVKDGVLRLLPLEQGATEEVIDSPEPVTDVFGAAGDKLLVVTTSGDVRTRRLYDRTARRWLREWPWRTDISLCRQGRRITVIADLSRDVAIEDLTGTEPLRKWTTLIPEPAAGVFSPDGTRLAFMSWKTGAAEVMDLPGGKRLAQFQNPNRGEYPPCAAWRPDGAVLATAPDVPDFMLWQIAPGNPWSRRISGHLLEVLHVAWHPSGNWLATTAYDGTLRLWNAAAGREILSISDAPRRVFFSQDGKRLLYDLRLADEVVLCALTPPVVVRDVELPHSSPDLHRQRGPWGVALTPDGKAAMVGGDNAWMLDASSGAVLGFYPAGNITHVLIPPDGSAFYLGQANAIARVPVTRSPSGGWTGGALEFITKAHGAARLAWSPVTQTLAGTIGNGVWLRQPDKSDAPVRRLRAGVEVNPLAISPDGRWVITGLAELESSAFIFDTAAPGSKPCGEIPLAPSTYHDFSKDSRVLYTAGGPVLAARETGTWRVLFTHPAPAGGAFNRLVLSGDGRVLAISTFPHGVQLRRASDGLLLATLRHPDARPAAWLALDEKATRLITTAIGHVIQSWDLTRLGEELSAIGLPLPAF